MIKKKRSKKGSHTHFCLRIIPRGKWKETDRRVLLNKIQEYRRAFTLKSGYDYHLFDKLTRISERPVGRYCNLCGLLYDILENKDPRTDTILFLGHHYLIIEEDLPEMITLIEMLKDDPKVKKFHMLYLDSLTEMKKTKIAEMQQSDVRNKITHKIIKISAFIDILTQRKFEIRTLYEVQRDSYY